MKKNIALILAAALVLPTVIAAGIERRPSGRMRS